MVGVGRSLCSMFVRPHFEAFLSRGSGILGVGVGVEGESGGCVSLGRERRLNF